MQGRSPVPDVAQGRAQSPCRCGRVAAHWANDDNRRCSAPRPPAPSASSTGQHTQAAPMRACTQASTTCVRRDAHARTPTRTLTHTSSCIATMSSTSKRSPGPAQIRIYGPCLPTSRLFIARAYRRRVCLWPVPLYSAASAAPAQCAADATGLTAAVHSTRHRSRDCTTAEYSPDFFATCVTWTSPFFRKPSIATKQPYLHACNGARARARAQNANGLGHARTDVHISEETPASLSHAYNARERSYDYKRTRAVAVLFAHTRSGCTFRS